MLKFKQKIMIGKPSSRAAEILAISRVTVWNGMIKIRYYGAEKYQLLNFGIKFAVFLCTGVITWHLPPFARIAPFSVKLALRE